MVQNVAGMLTELEPEDFHLLSGIEQGMRFSEWVAREKIPEFSRLTAEEVDYRIDRCLDRELIERQTIQYEGYRLKFEGYDALALHTFAERETLEGFGSPLGVGKESDVYEVQSYKPLALKYHREGYTNFREVMKERDYTSDREHVSWFYTARKAAEREYEALETLYPDVKVPRPVDHNRHAIVMEKIDGVELSRTKLEDEQVVPILDLILSEMADAYAAGPDSCRTTWTPRRSRTPSPTARSRRSATTARRPDDRLRFSAVGSQHQRDHREDEEDDDKPLGDVHRQPRDAARAECGRDDGEDGEPDCEFENRHAIALRDDARGCRVRTPRLC